MLLKLRRLLEETLNIQSQYLMPCWTVETKYHPQTAEWKNRCGECGREGSNAQVRDRVATRKMCIVEKHEQIAWRLFADIVASWLKSTKVSAHDGQELPVWLHMQELSTQGLQTV